MAESHFNICYAREVISLDAFRFPFELIPPGHGRLRASLERQHKRSNAHHGECIFDWHRIEEIESLNPALVHIGTKAWRGYAAFEFSYSNRVVLECPIEGNATYVLSGQWKRMICFNKAELREEFRNQHTKIVHKGDWLNRIRQALVKR